MAEHDAPGRSNLCECQRIRRRAGGHQEYRDIVLENFRQAPLDALGQVIIAITTRVAMVGLRDGIENGGRHRRRVVAGEIHVGKPLKDRIARDTVPR